MTANDPPHIYTKPEAKGRVSWCISLRYGILHGWRSYARERDARAAARRMLERMMTEGMTL